MRPMPRKPKLSEAERHGRAGTYTNQGCRCEACRLAHNAATRRWKQVLRERLNRIRCHPINRTRKEQHEVSC